MFPLSIPASHHSMKTSNYYHTLLSDGLHDVVPAVECHSMEPASVHVEEHQNQDGEQRHEACDEAVGGVHTVAAGSGASG